MIDHLFLRQLRKRTRLIVVARKVGVPRRQLQAIELGQEHPEFAILRNLAMFYQVPTAALLRHAP